MPRQTEVESHLGVKEIGDMNATADKAKAGVTETRSAGSLEGSEWRVFAERSAYRPKRMAEMCRMSLRQLERRFKMEMGLTPRRWLKQERLRSALPRLRNAESIKEVVYTLGYCQFSQFCREFKIGYGLTPSQFRRLEKSEQDRLIGMAPWESGKPTARLYRERESALAGR